MSRKSILYSISLGLLGQGLALILFMATLLDCTKSNTSIVVAYCSIFLVLTVAGSVFNVLGILVVSNDNEKFKRNRWVIITSIILNLVVCYIMHSSGYTGFISSDIAGFLKVMIYFANIIGMTALVVSSFIYLVELFKKPTMQNVNESEETDTEDEENVEKTEVDNEVKDALMQKLEKITAMHNQGLLTDKEYAELKEEYIKNLVK